MAEITEDEVLKELQRLTRTDQGTGLTTREWGQKLSMSERRVRLLLALAKSKNMLVVGTGYRERLDGRMDRVPLYSVKRPDSSRSWVKP